MMEVEVKMKMSLWGENPENFEKKTLAFDKTTFTSMSETLNFK